jgi:hypothetical protein
VQQDALAAEAYGYRDGTGVDQDELARVAYEEEQIDAEGLVYDYSGGTNDFSDGTSMEQKQQEAEQVQHLAVLLTLCAALAVALALVWRQKQAVAATDVVQVGAAGVSLAPSAASI